MKPRTLFFGLGALVLSCTLTSAQNYDWTTIAGRCAIGGSDGVGSAARFNQPRGVAVDRAGHIFVADTSNHAIREFTPQTTAAGTNWAVATIAGLPGVWGSSDGLGEAARFLLPQAVAVDNLGNVYVADTGNRTIRKLAPAGTNWSVSTIAGQPGMPGQDDGLGTNARFGSVVGIVADPPGDLYVVDAGFVRRLSPAGTNWMVTTLSNQPPATIVMSAIAMDAATNLYVGGGGGIAMLPPLGTNWVTVASLTNVSPSGLAVDPSGNVFLAAATAVLRLPATGTNGSVTAIAGSLYGAGTSDGPGGAALFTALQAITLDAAGNLYAADGDSHGLTATIRRVSPVGTNWLVTTLAGASALLASACADGTNGAATLSSPKGIARDGAGNLYVADAGHHAIRQLAPQPGAQGTDWVVRTIAGGPLNLGASATGAGGSAPLFDTPRGITLDHAGNVYVADEGNHSIAMVRPSGTNWLAATIAGEPGVMASNNGVGWDGTNQAAHFVQPSAIAVDDNGTLYVTDGIGLRMVTPAVGAGVTNWVVTTIRNGVWASGVAVDRSGDVLVLERVGRIVKFSSLGGQWESTTVAVAQVNTNWIEGGLAMDTAGDFYLTDATTNLGWSGGLICELGKVGTNWVTTTRAGPYVNCYSSSQDESVFNLPEGLTVDDTGTIYVADTGNNVIEEIAPLGTNRLVRTIVGTRGFALDGTGSGAGFAQPVGLAADSSGNIYVADSLSQTIRQLTPEITQAGTNWLVTTIAGQNAIYGWGDGPNLPGLISGPGGTNTGVLFYGPVAVAADSAGNVYVADYYNGVVRQLVPLGTNWLAKTIAGQPGNYALSPVDGTNGNAAFGELTAITTDLSGNLYVADNYGYSNRGMVNNCIRRVSPMGTNWVTTTLASWTGAYESPGIGGLALDSAGVFYVTSGTAVRQVRPDGTNWVVATIAGDPGTPGYLDGTNGAARFGGGSQPFVTGPTAIAVDSIGNLYVADTPNNSIRKITPQLEPTATNWVVTTIGGLAGTFGYADGPTGLSQFSGPSGLLVDSQGNLLVADRGNGVIRLGWAAPVVQFQMPSSFFHGTEYITWNASGFDPRSTVVQLEAFRSGTSYAIGFSTNVLTGGVLWDTTAVPDGLYELKAVFYNTASQAVGATVSETFAVNNSVPAYGGTLATNETWAAGVHVVTSNLVIASGVTLTVQPGAIVKFAAGAGIGVQSGGTLNVTGTDTAPVVFTSLADDTAGGDTNEDGNQSLPQPGAWTGIAGLGGQINVNGAVDIRYISLTAGGVLPGSQVWGNVLCVVTNSVEVPSGATLTILPGAVIKFAQYTGLVVDRGATLIAQGTVSQPITFTSLNDDTVAGNSNGQGNLTPPAAGDWNALDIEGTGTLDHVVIRYGGGGDPSWLGSGGGALLGAEGSVVISNSELTQGFGYGILTESGVTVQNCVVAQCDRGLQSGGPVSLVNCTFYQNRVGLFNHGGILALTNCIIAESFQQGINGWGGTTTLAYCDVWSSSTNGYVNYAEMTDPTGTDGDISADPKFVNADQGDFRLDYGSPCIDTADGTVTPPTDFMGAPRYNDPRTLTKTGVPDANGVYPDMGAFEFVESASSGIDLISTVVDGPLALVAGDTVQVQWTVANIGSAQAIGPWHDALSLVSAADSNLVLAVAEQLDAQGFILGPGQTYNASASVVVPGAAEGNYFWQVHVNDRGEIFEGANWTNDITLAAAPSSLTVPVLTLGGSALSGQLTASSQVAVCKIAPALGQDTLLLLEGSPTGSALDLYVGQGYMPGPSHFDLKSSQFNSSTASVLISAPNGGAYYVTVYARSLASSTVAYTLTATAPSFSLSSIFPQTIGNSSSVTLQINGFQLDPADTYQLVGPGGPFTPTAVQVPDSATAYATFNLAGALPGYEYKLEVIQPNGSILTLGNTVNVAPASAPQLSVQLQLPPLYRVGEPINGSVTYANLGNADMTAPILILTSGGQAGLRLWPTNTFSTNDLLLIGASLSGPAGILCSGQRWTINFQALSTSLVTIPFEVDYEPAEATDPIDYTAFESAGPGAGYSAADWASAWQQLQAVAGRTWGGFVNLMAHDATLMAQEARTGNDVGSFCLFQDVLAYALADCFAQTQTSVAGTLYLNDTNHPLAHATVSLWNSDFSQNAAAETTANGAFALFNMTSGIYAVSVPGYWLPSPLQVVVPASGSVTGLTVVVASGGTITGVVRDQSGSTFLTNVLVQAASGSTNGLFTATTGADGSFLLSGLPPDTYDLTVGGDPYETQYFPGLHLQAGHTLSTNFFLAPGATLLGKVVLNAAPLSNAVVTLTGASTAPASGLTDASGQFSLPGLAAGQYTLEVVAANCAPYDGVTNLSAGQTLDFGLISLGSGATLTTVLQVSGSGPATNSMASLQQGTNVVAMAPANTNGVVVFSGLAAGTYTLIESSYGFGNVTNVVTLSASGSLTNVSVTTLLGSVSGQVTDSTGAPISGLAVTVFGAGPTNADVSFTVGTDANGQYSLLGLRAGSYMVTFGNNGGIDEHEVVIDSSLAPQTLNVSLPGVQVYGLVLAADGATPIQEATVTLSQTNQLLATASTDTNGLYRFRVLLPGSYELQAWAVDGISSNVSVAVDLATSLVAPSLALGSLKLQGDVTDTSGQPLGNAMVSLLPQGASMAPQVFDASTSTNGQFLISGLVAGAYTVLVHQPGLAQLVSPLNISTTLYQSFVLSTGLSVGGQVTEVPGGMPLSNVIVSFFAPRTHFLTAIAATDASGHYTAGDLPAGAYDVVLKEPGHQVKVLPSVSVVSNLLNLDAGLAATNTLVEGTVTDALANPLANVLVGLVDTQTGALLAQAATSAEGAWSAAQLPAGTYQVTPFALGYLSPPPVTISLGAGVTAAGNAALTPAATDDGKNTYIQTTPTDFYSFLAQQIGNALLRLTDVQKPNCSVETSPAAKEICTDCNGYLYIPASVQGDIADKAWVWVNQSCTHWEEAYSGHSQAIGGSAGQAAVSALQLGASLAMLGNPTKFAQLGCLKFTKFADLPGASQLAAYSLQTVADGADLSAFVDTIGPSLSDLVKAVSEGDGDGTIINFLSVLNGLGSMALDTATTLKWLQMLGEQPEVSEVCPWLSVLKDAIGLIANAKQTYDDYKKAVGPLADAREQYLAAKKAFDVALANYNRLNHCPPFPPCKPPPNPIRTPAWRLGPGGEFDPNDKLTVGYGAASWVGPDAAITYTILFENEPSATLPVQGLLLTDQLDERLDWSTLQLSTIGFNNVTIPCPPGLQIFATNVTVATDPNPVQVNAALNPATGLLTWQMQSINPATGQPVTDPMAGFLPPDKVQGQGEGYVVFMVACKPGLATGTVITNQALVYFDQNAPVATPLVTNTIAATPPVSSVNPLPSLSTQTNLVVSWSGTDNGPGIAGCNVYVSTNGGPWGLWLNGTTNTSAAFVGTVGDSYGFYAIAYDAVGNWQPAKTTADAQTLVEQLFPLVVTVNGCGTLAPYHRGTNLLVAGSNYVVTATPCPGYSFAGWTGGLVTNTARLAFVMQPGLVLEANFAPLAYLPTNGTYYGLFYPASGVTHSNCGCLSLTATAKGSYTGQLQVDGGKFSITGKFSASGLSTNVVKRPGRSPLSLDLLMLGSDLLTGTVSSSLSNEVWTTQLTADRAVFNGKTLLAPQAGRYTLMIAGTNGSATLPRGDGFGALTVSAAGLVSFSGALADGTKLSQSVPVSQQGLWPLYVPLYGGQGSVLGWLDFTNAATLGGDLVWNKPASMTGLYPEGFCWLTHSLGSSYSVPGAGLNILGVAQSTLALTLEGGNLPRNLTNTFTLNAKDQIQNPGLTNKLTLKLTTATGLFSGSQVDLDTLKAVSFQGVILQHEGLGAGFFQGTNQVGEVWMGP